MQPYSYGLQRKYRLEDFASHTVERKKMMRTNVLVGKTPSCAAKKVFWWKDTKKEYKYWVVYQKVRVMSSIC